MDAQPSEQSGLNLPSPVNAQQPASGPVPESNQQTAAQMPTVPLPSTTQLPQNSSAANLNSTSQIVMQTLADDTDLIEKEWVSKAKQIVEHNREDPYEQSKELTIFKADYMKKRYNRTIKLSE
jgi:hypothetical protein